MRWLPLMLLAGCGEPSSAACSDAPLGGTCTHIEGRWLLEAGQRPRCGGDLFTAPVIIDSSGGGSLHGSVRRSTFSGTQYPDGVFELWGEHFSIQGQHLSRPDELRGEVSFPTGGSCDSDWQFIGQRAQ